MTPARLREYILIITRDALPPVLGAFGFVYLLLTHQFEPWHLPIIAGMVGVPLVAPRRQNGEPPAKELPP